jgi:two-component system sensor histidine kinase FlrB
MANAALQAETLKTAFNAFNHQSGLLEAAYRQLQEKVTIMASELASSQSARHQELLEKERLGNRLASMLEVLPSAVIVIDGDGFIVEHNSKTAELLNTPLHGCAWSVIVQREFCPGESVDGELKLKNGRWLSLARQSLDSEPGEILLLTDITDSRERSEMLQRHQRLSCIGEMTARLGHQFRTPLASALLYASQLDNPALANRKDIADKITSRLQDLAEMMDDMLSYAAGAKQSGDAVAVSDLLDEVADTIRPQLKSGDQLIVDDVDPHLVVDVNITALKGALLNLVNNAFQACKDNPRVELGAVRSNNQICLTVSDNGQGIGDEIKSRIYEPFFTTRPQGTGLGLAVVRSVAEAHNGDVLVDSGPAGTTFAVCLPVGRTAHGDKRNVAEVDRENRNV